MMSESSAGGVGIEQPTDNTLITVSLETNTNPLERLYQYFISERYGNPIPFGRWEKGGIALEIIGGSGGLYMLPVAQEFAKRTYPWLAWSIIITNPLSNVLFLANAADGLSDSITVELNPPSQLRDIIKPPSKNELIIKYLKMGLGSLICAVPFGVATYLFPLPDCDSDACSGFTVTHSIIANTILHAIAMHLILQPENWYYRLPIIPFEKAYQYIQNVRQTSESKQLMLTQIEQHKIYNKYKSLLGDSFNKVAEKIVADYAKSKSPDKLRSIGNDDSIMKFVGDRKPQLIIQEESSWRSYLRKAHHRLSNGAVGFIGATLTILGGSGWVANAIYLGLQEDLSVTQSVTIGALPTYSTVVLFAFYGASVLNQIYTYLTSWTGGLRNKLSLEAQLYPKTFAIFLLTNLYIAYFAYGSAQELIQTIFGDELWDDYRPILEDVSKPVFQTLSFVPLLNLFNTLIRKSKAKFGSEDDHQLATRLLLKTSVMTQHLQHMDGTSLMAAIDEFSEEQQQCLGIDPESFKADCNTLYDLERSSPSSIGVGVSSYSLWRSNTLKGKKEESSTTPLLQLDDMTIPLNYGTRVK